MPRFLFPEEAEITKKKQPIVHPWLPAIMVVAVHIPLSARRLSQAAFYILGTRRHTLTDLCSYFVDEKSLLSSHGILAPVA